MVSVHCKDISVRKVECDITEESIASMMDGWVAYKRAEYVVLNHGDQYAVVRLSKSSDGDLFRDVTDYEIISLPDDTVYVERPDMDVINVPALARLQCEYPGKAVVVRGLFSHLGFVKDLEPMRLRIVDCVPPRPSKMSYLVNLALASGYISNFVRQTLLFPRPGSGRGRKGLDAGRMQAFEEDILGGVSQGCTVHKHLSPRQGAGRRGDNHSEMLSCVRGS